ARAARVLRPLPPVGQLLQAPHGRPGGGLPSLLARRAVRRHRVERARRHASAADDDHLRPRRGELREQCRARAGAGGAGVSRRLSRRTRRPRLADVSARARAAPATTPEEGLAMKHLIGISLGTDDDWPRAFENIAARLGPVEWRGTTQAPEIESVLAGAFCPRR